VRVRLLRYKDQAELFAERFAGFRNLSFEVVDDMGALLEDAEVLVSCATYLSEDVAPDDAFPEGILVVPVHTRGFSNCDLFFDKVFADDTGHVSHFGNFERFRSFAEVADVVAGRSAGRESAGERILAYNIGLSIHDVAFAAKVWSMLDKDGLEDIDLLQPRSKFWV
jgi:ornithine cyclodeaminase/alanine dehydrogenase